ncbi:MAG: hypothetical protein IKQ30_01800 [Bacteroidales bacterium]|nr:hypothetical protein [Bacteroidales bacterium]
MNQNQDKVPVTLPADTMKKPYETPEIQAIVLNQQPGLLATSGFGASRSGYGDATEEEW